MSKELVILSGKGGTGKTSLCASFAVLAGRSILADCDVDAPDLHLLLSPRPKERHEFLAGWEVSIREEECTGCGLCSELCRFEAIEPSPGGAFHIVPLLCEGCRVCAHFCPARAIEVTRRYAVNGCFRRPAADRCFTPTWRCRLRTQENSLLF